jgi:hypothetical protein
MARKLRHAVAACGSGHLLSMMHPDSTSCSMVTSRWHLYASRLLSIVVFCFFPQGLRTRAALGSSPTTGQSFLATSGQLSYTDVTSHGLAIVLTKRLSRPLIRSGTCVQRRGRFSPQGLRTRAALGSSPATGQSFLVTSGQLSYTDVTSHDLAGGFYQTAS